MRGTIKKLKATGTIIPTISIDVELTNDRDEKIQIIGYSMKLSICNVPVMNTSKFEIMYIDLQRTEKIQEDFIINPYIFKKIENQRNGGDVPVSIQINGLSIDSNSNEAKSLTNSNFRDYYVNFDPNFKLSQRDWITMVSDMGYANYKIFEIAYNTLPDKSDFERILGRLEEAQTLFQEGKNEEVVTACRQAFEALRKLITIDGKFDEINPDLASIIDKGSIEKDDLKSKKMMESTSKILRLLHTGPHDSYCITREDAEYLLLLSISTVRYYVTQFNKFDSS